MEILRELKSSKGLINIFLVVLIVFIGASAINTMKEGKYIGAGMEAKNTMAFSGNGEVYVKPDLAKTTFSVVVEAKTVGEATSENTKKMNAIISSMKESGIEEKDLKTTSFNIYPRYEWRNELGCIRNCNNERILVGYEVRQSLDVKIRDLEKVGNIIQVATDSGANQIGDLQFTVENEDEFKNQAREEAIEEAKKKAKELSKELGVDLVRIVGFSEGNVANYYAPMAFAEADMLGKGGGSPEIETGENKISVSVNVVYEIK